MGFELAAAVAGFTFLGIWIDRRYDTEPWGLVVCAAIGVVGGMYNFVRAAQVAAGASGLSSRHAGVASTVETRGDGSEGKD